MFENNRYFDTLVSMVQREVADRLAAAPGGSEYGLLSATAQLYGRVEKLFTLPPEAFSPPPKEHSIVVRIDLASKVQESGTPGKDFISFLRLSFGQKRKTLWNNLKDRFAADVLRQAMTKVGVKATARAETLPLAKSAALFRALMNGGGK